MSLSGLENRDVGEALDSVKTQEGTWALLRYATRDAIALDTAGSDGLAGLKKRLVTHGQDSPLYGYLNTDSRRTLLRYVPQISRTMQARVVVHFKALTDHLAQQYDGIVTIGAASELTERSLETAPKSLSDQPISSSAPKSDTGSQIGTNGHFTRPNRSSQSLVTSEGTVTGESDGSASENIRRPLRSLRGTSGSEERAMPSQKADTLRPMTSPASPSNGSFLDLDEPLPNMYKGPLEFMGQSSFEETESRPRTSIQSTRTMGSVNYTGYTTFSGKPKLHARPSLLDRQRPHTSASVPRRQEHRPISTLPPGVSIKRKAGDPKANGRGPETSPHALSTKSLPMLPPEAQAATNNDLSVQPSSPRRVPHVADQMQRITASQMTPEKERLMRALAIRRANLSSSRANQDHAEEILSPIGSNRRNRSTLADTQTEPAILASLNQQATASDAQEANAVASTLDEISSQSTDCEVPIHIEDDQIPLMQVIPHDPGIDKQPTTGYPMPNSGIMDSNEAKLTSSALPLSTDLPMFVEEESSPNIVQNMLVGERSTPRDLPTAVAQSIVVPEDSNQVAIPSSHTAQKGSEDVPLLLAREPSPVPDTATTPIVSSIPEPAEPTREHAIDEETPFHSAVSVGLVRQYPEQIEVGLQMLESPHNPTQEVTIQDLKPPEQPRPVPGSHPTPGSDSMLEPETTRTESEYDQEASDEQTDGTALVGTMSGTTQTEEEQHMLKDEMSTTVRSADNESELSTLSDSDSLIESLQTARIENATPILVTPMSPSFPQFQRPRTPSAGRLLDDKGPQGEENNLLRPMTGGTPRPRTQESIIGVVGSGSGSGTMKGYGELSGLKTKTVNVSRGISQRIKALEMISSRSGSPQGASRPPTANGMASPPLIVPSSSQTSVKERSTSITNFAKEAQTPTSPKGKLPPTSKPSSFAELTGLSKLKVHGLGKSEVARPVADKPEPAEQRIQSTVEASRPNNSRSRSSVSVIARIIRSPGGGKANHDPQNIDSSSMQLHQSPITIEHQLGTDEAQSPSSRLRAQDPMASLNGNTHKGRRMSASSRRSSVSRTRARSPARTSMSSSSIAAFEDPEDATSDRRKKESRRSRIMKRMSSLSSNSRKSQAAKRNSARSPPVAEEDSEENIDPMSRIPENGTTVPSESFLGEQRKVLLDKEVNVQLPDSLLWRRRALRLDSVGYLILSPINSISRPLTAGGISSQSRHYHLGEFRAIGIPDEDMEDLPNTIQLEYQDGGLLQLACGYKSERDLILGKLKEGSKVHA